jgi:hypothetical protein
MRSRKVLIGIGFTLLVFIGIGGFALSRLDPNDYVDLLDAKVQAATGRELKIDGKVGYSLSLRPTIAAERVRLQNAPWGSRPDMITAKRIEIQIALLPLLKGNVEVRGLTLIEPDVLLEVGRDGAKNWEFKRKDTGAKQVPETASTQRIEVRRAQIEDGIFTYRDAKAKRTTRVDLNDITLVSAGNSIDLKGTGSLNAVPIEIDGNVDHGGRLGTAGAVGNGEFTLTALGAKLAARGAIPVGAGGLTGLEVKFVSEVSNWATLAKLTQGRPAHLPALKAEGRARADPDTFIVDELRASLGKSQTTGSVRIDLRNKRSNLAVRLDSPFVDLAELQAQGRGKPANSSPDGRLFSAEPFALDAVKDLNGTADLRIAKLALRGGKSLDGVQAKVIFNGGKVIADPIRVLVGGRELRMRLNADASSGKVLALNFSLDGQGISLGALATMFNVASVTEGSPTDVSIRLSGAGDSVRSLMAGANGDVRIVVGPGRIKNQAINFGADITELLNALNPARTSDPYTELKCAVIRLPIRRGIARVDKSIAAETAKVNVIVAGVIDLRNETLDLGFRPKALTGLGVGLGSLADLGRLRGSLAEPKVEIDAAGAATAAAQLGLAAATGGLSLLAGTLLTDSVPDHPCQVALTGVVRSQRAEAEQKPGIVESVVDGIKRLFGR